VFAAAWHLDHKGEFSQNREKKRIKFFLNLFLLFRLNFILRAHLNIKAFQKSFLRQFVFDFDLFNYIFLIKLMAIKKELIHMGQQ
jgi:hypothetical protein